MILADCSYLNGGKARGAHKGAAFKGLESGTGRTNGGGVDILSTLRARRCFHLPPTSSARSCRFGEEIDRTGDAAQTGSALERTGPHWRRLQLSRDGSIRSSRRGQGFLIPPRQEVASKRTKVFFGNLIGRGSRDVLFGLAILAGVGIEPLGLHLEERGQGLALFIRQIDRVESSGATSLEDAVFLCQSLTLQF